MAQVALIGASGNAGPGPVRLDGDDDEPDDDSGDLDDLDDLLG